ncbi:MAG: ring-cleaving dioxygenase [Candidatus Dormibacteraeota bacterium]|nr:ring-cleaving dioxygenase [Candidatus Dormibacteraeota bacterium]
MDTDNHSDPGSLGGLHHVTAITADASRNVAFYTRALGMRLVKRTVNQDDVSAYHLFYADAGGRPGTDLTFFDWSFAAPNRPGVGTVDRTSLRVPGASLGWWSDRFERLSIPHEPVFRRRGGGVLAFADPEGQRLELVADDGAVLPGGEPWTGGGVPPEHGVRGLFGVTLCVAAMEPTERILTQVMGFRRIPDEEPAEPGRGFVALFEVGPGGPGAEVRVLVPAAAEGGHPGRGGVHHVAFRTPTVATQELWLEKLHAARVATTPLIDRFYFSSLYFREPGGVLFEIATDGPGFAVDEPAGSLGQSLALPPFLEPRRREIEAGLRPIAEPTGQYA